jgi:SAM-dependent methyltransferase/predicted O-methyltransferase YrrM
MLGEIVKKWRRSKYDFRKEACPEDPLSHLFEEWVDYYRLKSAIASVIRPKKVLEIGVRYGYSAFAFLDGYPRLHYTGMDLDSNSFGGVKGAIDWARAKLPQKQSTIIIADSQTFSEFPGGDYDLIHVDGQQDGDGTFHDLRVALRQSKFILVDGFLWTIQNYQSANEFLIRNKAFIEYYCVIPGYAGELIIRVKDSVWQKTPKRLPSIPDRSSDISGFYDTGYFMEDCGGFDSFKKSKGKQILDSRLSSLLDIGLMSSPRTAMDIGCGRGEIVYQLAKRGIATTALDYSADAIEIARSCFDGESEICNRVEWLCADASRASFSTGYDLVIAGDIVEHMTPSELEALYANVSSSLNENGWFVVHTFPNKWFYQYDYERRRRTVLSLGAYLPKDPRSYYESLMHINEQSPRVLKKQLSTHFRHMVLWLGSPENPRGTLCRKFKASEAVAYRDIYAIASNSPIDVALLVSVLDIEPLPESKASRILWEVTSSPRQAGHSAQFWVSLRIANQSDAPISSYGAHPVKMSYHWVSSISKETVVFDGERTIITPSLLPHAEGVYEMSVIAPNRPGEYVLQTRIVQEMVRWHDEFATQKADVLLQID